MTTSDNQVRKLMEEMNKYGRIGIASLRAGMDTKTGRKYIKIGKFPSELKQERYWRPWEDTFFEINGEIQKKLQLEPFLTSKRLFIEFQELYPGKFDDNSLRTFQKRIESWRKSNNTIEATKAWVQSLQQGCIDLCELKKQYSHVITEKDIITLNYCILFKPLKNRNKALVIFSHLRGIPNYYISQFLHISTSIVKSYIFKFHAGGIDKLLDITRKDKKKYEEPKYKNEVFKILHEPPSLY